MASREDLDTWIVEALRANNGRASIVEVCTFVWQNNQDELRGSKDLFFTWQYDIRWAANRLRKESIMRRADSSPRGIWELA